MVEIVTRMEFWVGYSQRLQFRFGEFCAWEAKIPGAILDTPFMELTTDLTKTLPSWKEFHSTFRVAVVPAQPVERDLPRLALLPTSIRYVAINENRYYINLRISFSDYLKTFSSKSRNTLLRKIRRFEEFSEGTICWREFRTQEELDEFYRFARQVSKKTYQDRIGAGLPDSKEFCEELMKLASRDLMRGYVLFHGEEPIAYVLCPVQGYTLIYEHLGYDPAYRSWSPGYVLFYLMLERVFSEQCFRFLDFGGAEYGYKEFFSTDNLRCARILYFRRSWGNLLLVLGHISVSDLSFSVGRILQLLRIKEKIKGFTQFLQIKVTSLRR